MYNKELRDLALYRLEKAKSDLNASKKTLELEMYDTAANRSYYAIFHAARAVLALNGEDYKKHSGVISNFQKNYIKTGLLEKNLSNIIKLAFDIRNECDYEDFYIISRDDVIRQVAEAEIFLSHIEEYLNKELNK